MTSAGRARRAGDGRRGMGRRTWSHAHGDDRTPGGHPQVSATCTCQLVSTLDGPAAARETISRASSRALVLVLVRLAACRVGSDAPLGGDARNPYAPPSAIPCVLPNAFTWGDQVLAFFIPHPM